MRQTLSQNQKYSPQSPLDLMRRDCSGGVINRIVTIFVHELTTIFRYTIINEMSEV